VQHILFPVFLLFLTPALAQTASQPPTTAPAQAQQMLSPEIREAETALAQSDWKTASTKLSPWLVTHPGDARALFDAGYAADALGHSDEAVALYQRSVTADPMRFEARLSLGMLLARLGRMDEARPHLAAATQLDPGEVGVILKGRAWRALARIDRSSDPATASNDLTEAFKVSPETIDDTLLAAEIAEQDGQPDEAEQAYRRVLKKDSHSADANAGLAHLMMARKQYAEAEVFLRAALEQSPENPVLTAQLATVLANQDKAEALPLAQKLHATHPENVAITNMLAALLTEAGDYAASDHLLLQLIATQPNDPALLVNHGQNLIRQLKFAEALAVFEKAAKADASNAEAWSGMAFAASRANQPAITLQALTERARYQPELPTTLFLRATAYDSLHQNQQAAAYYHRFLEAAAGKFPDQEWQARQRLQLIDKKR